MQVLGQVLGLTLFGGLAACVPAPRPAFPTVLAETPAQAQSVLSCDNIALERAAIAASPRRLDQQPLADRDAELAQLQASKGCAPH